MSHTGEIVAKLKLRAFRAINEPETCERYYEGHMNVLSIFKVTKVTSAQKGWISNPASYVITAEDQETGEMVGGIRVHVVGGTQPLPVEEAVGSMDPHIYEMVETYGKLGAGELCGLWNARSVAGLGISVILTRAGVSIANQIRANTIFGICANFTLPMFKSVGYKLEKSLGNNGTFYYPKEDFIANALIMEAINLEDANPYDREIINSLRQFTKQTRIEEGPKGPIEISYDLKIADGSL